MIARWKRPLVFLRLVDEHDGNLSLTNLGVMVALYGVVRGGTATVTELGALFTVLASYSVKKALYKKAPPKVVVVDDRPREP